MRIVAKIAGGIAATTLVITLAACGGGATTANSDKPASAPATAGAVSQAPASDAGLPKSPVCQVITADMVAQATGVRIYSFDNNDVLAGQQKTVCMYYTAEDQSSYIEVHWMTIPQSDWANTTTPISRVTDNETITVSHYPELGDDAAKSTDVQKDMPVDGQTLTSTEYWVRINHLGLVLDINNSSLTGVTDDAFLAMVRMVVQRVETSKL